MRPPNEQVKAIVGAAIALLTSLGGALADSHGVSAVEWCAAGVATLTVYAGVYRANNDDPKP